MTRHDPGAARVHRIVRRLVDARQRAADAHRYGDTAGAAYAMAEVRRLRSILAEG